MKPLVFLVLINNVSSSSVVRSDSDIITLLFWVLPIDHNILSCTKIYITLSIQHKPYRVTLSCIYAPDKIICQRTWIKSYTNVPIFFNIFNYSSCQWIMLKIVILVESIVYCRKLNSIRDTWKKNYSYQCTFWQQFDFVFSIIYLLQ